MAECTNTAREGGREGGREGETERESERCFQKFVRRVIILKVAAAAA